MSVREKKDVFLSRKHIFSYFAGLIHVICLYYCSHTLYIGIFVINMSNVCIYMPYLRNSLKKTFLGLFSMGKKNERKAIAW